MATDRRTSRHEHAVQAFAIKHFGVISKSKIGGFSQEWTDFGPRPEPSLTKRLDIKSIPSNKDVLEEES